MRASVRFTSWVIGPGHVNRTRHEMHGACDSASLAPAFGGAAARVLRDAAQDDLVDEPPVSRPRQGCRRSLVADGCGAHPDLRAQPPADPMIETALRDPDRTKVARDVDTDARD